MNAILAGEQRCRVAGVLAHVGYGLVDCHCVVGHGVAVPLLDIVPGKRISQVGQYVQPPGIQLQVQVVALAVPHDGVVVEHERPAIVALVRFEYRYTVAV